MAKNMLMRLVIGSKSKAYHALGLLCLALLVQKSDAREFNVGAKGNWAVPTDNSSFSYSQWAERNRFQIGDSIVFSYASGQDSVLQVDKDSYTNCSTDYPMARYTDGHTVFTFNQSGPYYFISGNKENCLKNEKLVAIVLADRSNRKANTTGNSPSPSPSQSRDVVPSPSPLPSPSSDVVPNPSPPPLPTSGIVPAPAPAGENSHPEGTVEVNPTPAPEPNKPNAASFTFISLVRSIGAFAASSLLLAF